ncbi:MAG: FAD:protein FMN transferase [Opitutae bacterium]|nr:FAD:protein FMN transferase [Opitutae bacterium]
MNVLLASLAACAPSPRAETLAGRTMGTTYSIRIADAALDRRALDSLQADVNATLAEVNRQMSTYQPDSEIARFNRAAPHAPLAISPDFQFVARRALALAEATGGAFDPTVGALVNLWGFGPDGAISRRPAPEQIEAARQTVGFRHLSLSSDGRLAKDIPGLKLDLSAIAKGYGVDRVAALLRKKDIENFLVEIGGETLAAGLNAEGVPWRVGVRRPDPDPAGGPALEGVLHLTGGRAIATSGDYQNFFRDENGQLQSHLIDPRTAAPVQHAVASVSVLAPDCLTADALATALVVLGPAEGLPLLAAAFPGVEALFILRHGGDQFEEVATPGFAAALRYAH